MERTMSNLKARVLKEPDNPQLVNKILKVTGVNENTLNLEYGEIVFSLPRSHCEIINKRILITGGAVHEHLDSVKIVTNKFKGGTIAHLADVLSEDLHVIYLTSKHSKVPKNKKIEVVLHEGFHDYMDKVKEISKTCDGVILGAAVANLIPVTRWEKKFPSHNYKEGDIIPIDFTVAPRVINKVKEVAPKTTLIGFKLLQGVEHSELVDAAYEVLLGSKATFVIANDADNLAQKYIVTKEKNAIPLKGEDYYKFLLNSLHSEYYRTEVLSPTKQDFNVGPVLELEQEYLEKLFKGYDKKNNLAFGSVSLRGSDDKDISFITTARKKFSYSLASDIVAVKSVDHAKRTVYAYGQKPSLNTPLIDNIFKSNSEIQAIIHYHELEEGLPTLKYHHPGTLEDSNRIIEGSFNIENHGAFILLDKSRKRI
jgi:hypothetical protein